MVTEYVTALHLKYICVMSELLSQVWGTKQWLDGQDKHQLMLEHQVMEMKLFYPVYKECHNFITEDTVMAVQPVSI